MILEIERWLHIFDELFFFNTSLYRIFARKRNVVCFHWYRCNYLGYLQRSWLDSPRLGQWCSYSIQLRWRKVDFKSTQIFCTRCWYSLVLYYSPTWGCRGIWYVGVWRLNGLNSNNSLILLMLVDRRLIWVEIIGICFLRAIPSVKEWHGQNLPVWLNQARAIVLHGRLGSRITRLACESARQHEQRTTQRRDSTGC
jgi:hypothetical protein